MPELSLFATLLMFTGGAVLTYDALRAPRGRKVEEGADFLAESRDELKGILDYFRGRQHARTWWGFLLTTLGFLLELVVKGVEVAAGS